MAHLLPDKMVGAEHIVQLFDTPESLSNVVSAFLYEGWLAGDSLLAVAKPSHWARVAGDLERHGCDVDRATRDGRLIVLNAAATLALVLKDGVVDGERFSRHVGRLVGRMLVGSKGRLRIYGEMVELLAADGDLRQAHRLEELWNQLGERQPYVLLCGYSAAHFTGDDGKRALEVICAAHTRVQTHSSDMLGNWLLGVEGLPT